MQAEFSFFNKKLSENIMHVTTCRHIKRTRDIVLQTSDLVIQSEQKTVGSLNQEWTSGLNTR